MRNIFSISFLRKELIRKKLNSPLGYFLLLACSMFFVVILKFFGDTMGFVSLILLIGIPLGIASLVNSQFGYGLALVYSYFLFLIYRLGPDIPYGVFYDFIFYVILFGILLKEVVYGKSDWSALRNPIFIILYIWSAYLVLQVFNPNAVSISAYAYGMRGLATKFCILLVAVYTVTTYKFVENFTKLWLILAVIAALYSFKQEYIGFFDFERRWIFAEEGRFRLIFIWGSFRKWSFLSDVNAFGLLMAFTSIFCLILALGPYKFYIKIILVLSAILTLMGMTFSGTRTAYAMIPVGLALYFIMTMNNPKTIIFGLIGIATIGLLLFGPFYGGHFTRIKSLVNADEDPSMNVRNQNRDRVQPYILSNPMGGGLMTVGTSGLEYSPGHPLAGFPPDSGYLATALETGWIGLILEMIFLATVLIVGVKNYYKSKDPTIKNLYCAYLSALFALTVANYAQDALYQKPIGLIVYTSFILMFRLYEIDKKLQDNATSV